MCLHGKLNCPVTALKSRIDTSGGDPSETQVTKQGVLSAEMSGCTRIYAAPDAFFASEVGKPVVPTTEQDAFSLGMTLLEAYIGGHQWSTLEEYAPALERKTYLEVRLTLACSMRTVCRTRVLRTPAYDARTADCRVPSDAWDT